MIRGLGDEKKAIIKEIVSLWSGEIMERMPDCPSPEESYLTENSNDEII